MFLFMRTNYSKYPFNEATATKHRFQLALNVLEVKTSTYQSGQINIPALLYRALAMGNFGKSVASIGEPCKCLKNY